MFSLSSIWVYGLLIFPFFFITGIPFPYIYPKVIFIEVWAAIGLLVFSFKKEEDQSISLSGIELTFIALTLFGFLSLFWSEDIIAGLFGPFWRGTGLVFYSALILAGLVFKERGFDKESFAKFVLYAGTGVSIILFSTAVFDSVGQMQKNLMGNPNASSMWVGTTVLLNYLYGEKIFKNDKFKIGFVYLINIVVVLMLGSRSAIFGVLLGLLIASFLGNKKIFKRSVFITLGATGLMLAQYFLMKESVLKNLIIRSKQFYRIDIWDGALNSFLSKPFLGYGFHGLIQGYWENYTSSLIVKHAWNDNAHSLLLNLAAELGIFGVLGFMALCFFFGKELLRKEGADKSGWLGILFYIGLYSAFQPFYVDSSLLILFIVLVMGGEEIVKFSRKNIVWKGAKIVLAVCLLVIAFYQYSLMTLANQTRHDIVGKGNYRKTWNQFMKTPSFLDKPGVFLEISNQMRLPFTPAGARFKVLQKPFSSFMVNEYSEVIKEWEHRPRSLENYSMWLVRRKKMDDALIYLDKILKRSDRVTKAYYNKAHVYIMKKDYKTAKENLLKVKELNPNFDKIDKILSRFK